MAPDEETAGLAERVEPEVSYCYCCECRSRFYCLASEIQVKDG